VVPISRALDLDLNVAGKPVLHWTLSALTAVAGLVKIVVASETMPSERHIPPSSSRVPVRLLGLEPGTGRIDAIRSALATAGPARRVLIHDADRPLTTPAGVEAVLRGGDGLPAAIAAVTARNTLKRVVDGVVVATVPRERLAQALTPAVFERALLEGALRRAQKEAWRCVDEVELATMAGIPTRLVPGDALNVPISRPESVPFAELTLGRSHVPAGGTP
jgi:2-C-methyl-D-erythritol 4-phosphate cytidylyltransferase